MSSFARRMYARTLGVSRRPSEGSGAVRPEGLASVLNGNLSPRGEIADRIGDALDLAVGQERMDRDREHALARPLGVRPSPGPGERGERRLAWQRTRVVDVAGDALGGEVPAEGVAPLG